MTLILILCAIAGVGARPAGATHDGVLTWVHQLGTDTGDTGNSVVVDGSGNVYVTGSTQATLPGSPDANAGPPDADVFVASWTAAGGLRWVRQLGSPAWDVGLGVALDSGGNVYVTGQTRATLAGSPEANAGDVDAFVASWTSSGTPRWVHQIGTGPYTWDVGTAVAVDAADTVYVTGWTDATLPGSLEANSGGRDIFLTSWTSSGTLNWVHQLGTSDFEEAQGVAVDTAGSVYVTGSTLGTLPGSPDANAGGFGDVFVAGWTSTGTPTWVRQLGTGGDESGAGVAVYAGNVYVTGGTNGTLPGSPETNAGDFDAFVASWTTSGTPRWVDEIGSAGTEWGSGVAVDGAGNVYVTGVTAGTLPGSAEANPGEPDAFLTSWTVAGALNWVHQLGTTSAYGERAGGVAADTSGNAYIAGWTLGTLPGSPETNAGLEDVFVARWSTADPAADSVSVAVTGGVTYSNAGFLDSGDFTIGANSITGTGTLPGVGAGSATVAINATKVWIFPVYLGSVSLNDSGAGVHLNTPVLFSKVARPTPASATSTHGWWDFSRWPWRPYALHWTVTDNG